MLTAIVGILLGNLLIACFFAPSLQKLRQILEKFADIELPHHNVWSPETNLTPEQRRLAESKAVQQFNRLFREYVMSFNAFKRVSLVFGCAIAVLACAVAWQASLGLLSRILVMILCVAVVVFAAGSLQRAIAPTPDQLVSIDFFQNNFANLHLQSLIDVADLHVNFGRAIASRDSVMHFSLFTNLMFSGYKVLMAISDAEFSRVFFVAYGQPASRTSYQQNWSPELLGFSIPLGDFSMSDALLSTDSLQLSLWLFIPTPEGWVKDKTQHPRFLSEEITVNMGGNIGLSLYSGNCTWNSVDERVDFDRNEKWGIALWKITRVDPSGPNSPQNIVRMFKEKIERSRAVKNGDYPAGLTVRS